jgi:hypothetical protein
MPKKYLLKFIKCDFGAGPFLVPALFWCQPYSGASREPKPVPESQKKARNPQAIAMCTQILVKPGPFFGPPFYFRSSPFLGLTNAFKSSHRRVRSESDRRRERVTESPIRTLGDARF